MAAEPEHEAVLYCEGFTAWYGEGPRRVPVFESLDLRIEHGEVLGVFGPNGCGKSTLTRALLGLHEGCAGQVTLATGGRVGWVPQAIRESFFAWTSVRENLLLTRPAGEAARPEQLARIDSAARELEVVVDLGLRPPQLSDGQLQQVAMVRALACAPALLLADECFSALDVDAARRLRRALRQRVKTQKMAAVLVLHDLDALLELADRVLVIERRPFTLRDPSARLMSNTRIGQASAEGEPAREGGLVDIVRRLLEPDHG